MANIMRFVILGDDRGGPAFASFTKQVEKANQAVDRNNAALKRQGAAAKDARGGIAALAGEVTGFGAAADAASAGGSKFRLALAGINLATGVLEPALAGVVVAAGGLAAGFAAAGAGIGVFGAVAKSVFTEASKGATAYAAAQAKYASATTTAQRVAALKAEKAAFAGMAPPVKALAIQLGDTQKRWKAFTNAAAPGVVGVISKGLGLLPKILASMKPFLAPVEKALRGIIGQLNTGLSSSGFTSFIGALAKNTGPAITKIAAAIGNVVIGIGGILKAFLPTSQSLLSGIDKITAKFRVWGTTLSGHTGFQSLMATFRTETPLAVQVLRNLGTVILNVGKAMTGLAGVGNSKSLLQLLLPLSGILASLSRNTGLVRLALYLYAATSAAGKLKPAILGVQGAIGFFGGAWKAVAKFAAVTEGATVAETIAAAATRAWGIAMTALPWVALAAAVVAVAVLIIKYHRQIWAFVQRVWHDILGVISGVWNWVKTHWPLLLGILTGPVGLAVLVIVRNFGKIKNAVLDAWDHVKLWTLQAVDTILRAFSHVPFIGHYFAQAHKVVAGWITAIQKDINRLQGRTVNVQVRLTSGQGIPRVTQGIPAGVRRASGGRIRGPGGPRDDRAGLYALSNDEWVIRADSAARYGHAAMAAVNEGRAYIGYAGGGYVGLGERTTVRPSPAQVEASLLGSVTKLAKAFAKTAAAFTGMTGDSGVRSASAAAAQAYARSRLGAYGWGADQWAPLLYLWNQESGWSSYAVNKSSGAYGIPQSLGHGHPYNLGDYVTQVNWGLNYIKGRYGSPAGAWAHERGFNWYDQGGIWPARSIGINGTSGPEAVLTRRQWTDLHDLLVASARHREPSWLARLMQAHSKVLAALERGQQKAAANTAAAKAYAGQQTQSLTSYAGLSGVIGTTAPPQVSAGQIVSGLQQKLRNLRNFGSAISRLAAKGLSRALLRQIIDMGPDDGLSYARAILDSPGVIRPLNTTEAAIGRAAAKTGRTQADAVYGTRGGNTYHITVNAPPNVSKAAMGREIVELIREYERGSGKGWRR